MTTLSYSLQCAGGAAFDILRYSSSTYCRPVTVSYNVMPIVDAIFRSAVIAMASLIAHATHQVVIEESSLLVDKHIRKHILLPMPSLITKVATFRINQMSCLECLLGDSDVE